MPKMLLLHAFSAKSRHTKNQTLTGKRSTPVPRSLFNLGLAILSPNLPIEPVLLACGNALASVREDDWMIRLIVMYNLPDGADEKTFLDWRLGPHQASNASMPQVSRTDFARIIGGWPEQTTPRFRFVTVVEWPDHAAFEAAFYAPSLQTDLRANLNKLGDYEYSISEILPSSQEIGVA